MIDSFLRYLEFEKRYSAKTIRSYETDLTQFLTFLKANYSTPDPDSANFGMIRSWIVQLSEENLNATSINRKIACLRSFFKFLMRQGIITKDPTLKVKVLKTKKKLPQFVNEEEMAA
ncbi:MAG: site-specific integrase, partial [Bacteroidota bacterium]